MILTPDTLLQIMPRCNYPLDWVRPLNDTMDEFEIDNIARRAMFLGQIAHESNQLNTIEERLNYSPRRCMEVWPDRFPELKLTNGYARNPEKLANLVYADRMGNGDPGTGDGFRYRGRGLIQITGKANYAVIAARIDLPSLVDMPDKLLTPKIAAQSAGAFWSINGLNAMADRLGEKTLTEVVEAITRRVNGGINGLDDRIRFTSAAIGAMDMDFAA